MNGPPAVAKFCHYYTLPTYNSRVETAVKNWGLIIFVKSWNIFSCNTIYKETVLLEYILQSMLLY